MLDITSKYNRIHIDPNWDNKTMQYDLSRYNWPEKFLNAAQEKFPQITDLTKIHEVLSTNDLLGLRNHIESYTRSAEFCADVDELSLAVERVEAKLNLLKQQSDKHVVKELR